MSWPQFFDHLHNIRDYIPRFLQYHSVPDTHVEALNLVFIVQGGARYRGTGDRHRFQMRDWREHSSATDLQYDILDDGRRLLGWEFESNREAWRFPRESKCLLVFPLIYFDYDAVHPIILRTTFILPLFPIFDDLFYIPRLFVMRIYLESQFPQIAELFFLRLRKPLGRLRAVVHIHIAFACSRYARIELPDRACSDVARACIQRRSP